MGEFMYLTTLTSIKEKFSLPRVPFVASMIVLAMLTYVTLYGASLILASKLLSVDPTFLLGFDFTLTSDFFQGMSILLFGVVGYFLWIEFGFAYLCRKFSKNKPF